MSEPRDPQPQQPPSGTPALNPQNPVPPPRDPGPQALADAAKDEVLKTARPPLGN